MSEDKKHIQEGYTAITPYLFGDVQLIEFLKQVFGAELVGGGKPEESGLHSELKIGDAKVMVGSGWFADSSMSAATWVYVADVDATYKRALDIGATSVRQPADMTWGDRVSGIKDKCGNTWWIATHKISM
jgi:uncharacterized glyoxalase superfamily protein PhnB